jgi:hypothetical protein
MVVAITPTAAGSNGIVASPTGTATETLSSASTLDLLVTATNNTTQNYTLSYITVTKQAA